VITLILSGEVLGNTRFAFSPMSELTLSVRLLGCPMAAHPHTPWIREARSRLEEVDVELLHAVAPPGKWIASSLMPGGKPDTSIESQLQALATSDPSALREDLDEVWAERGLPRRVRDLFAPGGGGLTRLSETMWDYWDAAIGPFWPRMCAVLEDDVSHRAGALVNDGLLGLLTDLHPEVSVGDGRLYIDKPHHSGGEYEAGQMTLTPSVFAFPHLIVDEHAEGYRLVYAARGVGRVWEGLAADDTNADDDHLVSLLGRTRAAVLRHTAIPMSTTQIAKQLDQTPGSVSQHLMVLRSAGLVRSWRSGRSVLYRQTALAASMIAAQEQAERPVLGQGSSPQRLPQPRVR
jgi:DNA-binding transcriptional ArsR family regulator